MNIALVTSIVILSIYSIVQILMENHKTPSRKYLFAIIIILALSQIPSSLMGYLSTPYQKLMEQLPTRHWVFLIGPALCCYARSIMGEKERPRALLHILPTLLWWAIFLFTLGRHIQNPIIPRIYGFTCLLSLLSYGILIQLILARYAKKLKNQISYTDMFLEVKWLSYMAGALVIITLFVSVGITLYLRQNAPSAPPIHKLLGDPDSIDIMHSLAVLTFLFVFTLLAQKQERLGFKSLPTKSPCSPKDEPERPETASHAFTELTSFMDKSKIYLENTLSLQVLSDKTGINRNELSRLINKETGENFFHFINGYRAREFKEALKEDRFPCYNLLAIAHECGFNSKATFNSAIKREFDVTPSQIYREIGSTL